VIGDGRTAALVAGDGSVDWLCLPNFDSPSVFAAILDAERGGTFEVQPVGPFESTRRYLPGTNVLETTFTAADGVVRVTDAMTVSGIGLEPMRELVRAVEGLSGRVPMRWRLSPRFDYGAGIPERGFRHGIPVACCGGDAVAVASWDAGRPEWCGDSACSRFEVAAGGRSLLSLAHAHEEPLVLPGRKAVEHRLDDTIHFWEGWTSTCRYDGCWREQVLRSALLLKLLIFAPSGASVAAPTTSLPEDIGGERNWDYRFCWIRDSSFAMEALLAVGRYAEAEALFWWFLQATARTEPELRPLYRLDGGIHLPERTLPLAGYRGSRPVRVGNGAIDQLQLDIYGHLFETAWLFSRGERALDGDMGAVLARIADYVCEIWRSPDAGIWEVRNGAFHFTHSKVMAWVALDRACRLAELGEVPRKHTGRWQREAAAIQAYVENDCWSDRLNSYTRSAGDSTVDASLLMLPLIGYGDPKGSRMNGTIDAIVRELRRGDFVYRYIAADGLAGGEGCFLNCSFWLVSALAHAGRVAEASELMERLVARANDVGLYAEEIDPQNGEFLGNFPQALVHLALIDAAIALDLATGRRAAVPGKQ
jgi:GH15 family glucan-1,4-alpha-glucosidase